MALNNTYKNIVIYGNVGTTLGLGKFNRLISSMVQLPKHILSQLTEHLLGDGHIRRYPKSRSFSFEWAQTIKRFE